MWKRDLLFVALVAGGGLALAVSLMPPLQPTPKTSHDASAYADDGFRASVHSVDALFEKQWGGRQVRPAEPAPGLTVARRLSLALMGTIPSLEEIRQFETLPADQRLGWWLDHILQDPRFNEYFAERLARAYVGTENGPFIFYRRRRFTAWLEEQLAKNRPYDELVRELIAARGLWTNAPATNYTTVTVRNDMQNQPDPVRLAGRTMRAFLAIRLDCVECHNSPSFLPGTRWKQTDFQGVAAYFGRAHTGFTGIYEAQDGEFEMDNRRGGDVKAIEPRVPYSPHLLGEGNRREQLANWVTHKENPFFARAIVNRVWALMLGRPLVSPVDSLDASGAYKPDSTPKRDQGVGPLVLEALAKDFVAHGHDLRRLIRVIAATRVFRLDSAHEGDLTEEDEKDWLAFPLTRLRPEQVAGGVIQASLVTTIDYDSHIFTRLGRFFNEREFLERYGDTGEDELEGRGGTIPQRLLLMNGKLVRERIKQDLFNASTRIAETLPDNARAVEAAYLVVLSRRPTDEEREHFVASLEKPGVNRPRRFVDIFWALINSTEFSWNH